VTISGVPDVLPPKFSSTVNQISSLLTSVGEDGVNVTLSASPTDAVNLQQDITSLNISVEVLKSEMQDELSVADMLQNSVDMRI
jgi:hypothetical protein